VVEITRSNNNNQRQQPNPSGVTQTGAGPRGDEATASPGEAAAADRGL
jgi:hypothetical protein